MKIAVSYLSSKFSLKDTIKKINDSDADYIHMDIMDGKYVENKNFKSRLVKKVIKLSKKKIDVHLMTNEPSKYLKYFKDKYLVKNLFFHPYSEKDPFNFIQELKKNNISPGIVINPDENILDFKEYYQNVDRVLLMSVNPGAGGQKFIKSTVDKIIELTEYKKKNKEMFEIALDGGINDKTIKYLEDLQIDYVISGSFICQHDDYNEQIILLK